MNKAEKQEKQINEHIPMITVITRFAVPATVNATQMRAAFAQAAPAFRNVPGLIRKQFLLSPDGRTAGGVYLWQEEEAARTFMQQQVTPMLREKFHIEPTIEFYHSPVLVENSEPKNMPE